MQQKKWNALTAGHTPDIINSKTACNLFVLFLGAVLTWFLGKNIAGICTVWELGDEAGYLGNAACFAGYDWSAMLSNNHAYYAYGYSIFLVPVFWFADTGAQTVQGACIVNIICVLGIYLIQICIMEKLCKHKNRIVLAVISFIASLYPYIVSNALKVDCETILAFWYLLSALLLYYAVRMDKVWLYGLLGLCSAYILFIHTRAFVPIGGLAGVLLIVCFRWQYKKSGKKILIFMTGFLVSFICLNIIKASVLQLYAGESVSVPQATSVGNTITMEYIMVRLVNLLAPENMKLYILSFLAKLFYIGIGTCAMGFFGWIHMSKEAWGGWKSMKDTQESAAVCAVQLYLLLGITLMILFQTVSTVGDVNNFTYFFYGRYYEFAITPIIFFGLYSCIYEKQAPRKIMCIMSVSSVLGIVTAQLGKYLNSHEIHKDTSRIAAFADIVEKNDNYVDMIVYGALLLFLFLGVYLAVCCQKWSGTWILLMVLAGTLINSSQCVDIIMNANDSAKGDTMIAEYIRHDASDNRIYVIEEPYKYPGYYCRMQVLIKNDPIHIILPEQLDNVEEGSWIITYKDSEMGQVLSDCKVLEGSVFELFQK